jgi:hypothetical protein
MKRLLAPALLAASLSVAPVSGWGFDPHRFVTSSAIDLLPPAIRPFYDKHRVYLVEHSIDPDLWRNAGFEQEPPNHFLDLDAYGAYPFAALPRDYGEAVAKFGKEKVDAMGTVPWRTAEMFDRLVKAFEEQKAGLSGYALEDVKFLSAVLAHYVGDAHVPFHAVVDYDGRATGQHGIHSRFESELFRRYEASLRLSPPPLRPIPSARDFVFDTLLEGSQLVPAILDADRRAVEGKELYDDEYFDRFLASVKPVLERRLAESASAIASILAAAWERGGKPELPLDPPRIIRKVRRPGA